jgi:hypothetical protein
MIRRGPEGLEKSPATAGLVDGERKTSFTTISLNHNKQKRGGD